MATLQAAVRESLVNCRHWLGGAVVVTDGSTYDAIPGAYLTDVSYLGPRDVVTRIENLAVFGDGGDVVTDDDVSAIVDMIIESL